jgi:hypothetical protein
LPVKVQPVSIDVCWARREAVSSTSVVVRTAFTMLMMEVPMTNATLQQRLASAGPFTKLLRELWERSEKSQADIARDAWIDPGYLSKLLSGEKDKPSRDTVIRLAVFGLNLTRYETDDLLIAASYAPLVVERNRE